MSGRRKRTTKRKKIDKEEIEIKENTVKDPNIEPKKKKTHQEREDEREKYERSMEKFYFETRQIFEKEKETMEYDCICLIVCEFIFFKFN